MTSSGCRRRREARLKTQEDVRQHERQAPRPEHQPQEQPQPALSPLHPQPQPQVRPLRSREAAQAPLSPQPQPPQPQPQPQRSAAQRQADANRAMLVDHLRHQETMTCFISSADAETVIQQPPTGDGMRLHAGQLTSMRQEDWNAMESALSCDSLEQRSRSLQIVHGTGAYSPVGCGLPLDGDISHIQDAWSNGGCLLPDNHPDGARIGKGQPRGGQAFRIHPQPGASFTGELLQKLDSSAAKASGDVRRSKQAAAAAAQHLAAEGAEDVNLIDCAPGAMTPAQESCYKELLANDGKRKNAVHAAEAAAAAACMWRKRVRRVQKEASGRNGSIPSRAIVFLSMPPRPKLHAVVEFSVATCGPLADCMYHRWLDEVYTPRLLTLRKLHGLGMPQAVRQ